MDQIRQQLNSFIRYFDNGQFFMLPVKWLLLLKGILPFAIPVYWVYYFVDNYRFINMMGDGWFITMVWLFFVIIFGVQMCWCFMNLMFWINRRDKLMTLIHKGDRMVALPLLAYNIRYDGESLASFVGVLGSALVICFYLFCLFSGFDGFYHDAVFLKAFLGMAVAIVALVVSAYLIALIARFISEQITLFVSMSKDLRDVADINRAAVVVDVDE